MDWWVWLVAVVALVCVGWAGWTYNRLVRRRNGAAEAWATVDVELRRRHDLVPALVEAVRGYAEHESGILKRVAKARARAVAGPDAAAESALTDAVRSLFAVAEAYPDLRASEQFRALQDQLALTEDRIAYARALYNAWVTEYEGARQTFPSLIVARLARFPGRDYFEAEVVSRQPVAVALDE